MIPARALEGLTAEDLRLLINGVGDINVQVRTYTYSIYLQGDFENTLVLYIHTGLNSKKVVFAKITAIIKACIIQP